MRGSYTLLTEPQVFDSLDLAGSGLLSFRVYLAAIISNVPPTRDCEWSGDCPSRPLRIVKSTRPPIMSQTTIPAMSDAFSRKHADALVASIASEHPECTAYPHAWGDDWGVTITGPIDAIDVEEMVRTIRSLVYLGLV